MNHQTKDKASELIRIRLEEEKKNLKDNLHKILGVDNGSVTYKRRLDKIYKTLTDNLMTEGDAKKLLVESDYYQKIELFMTYKEGKDEATNKKYITTNIYDIIGEVFKSMYILLILSFLEGEEFFYLPYIGKIAISDVVKFNSHAGKNSHYFYGKLILDRDLKRDLAKIDREEKLQVIKDILNKTRKNLMEKVY
jgi:hypothetical protein